MKIKLNGEEITPPDNVTSIKDLLKSINISLGSILVTLNGEISIEEESLKEGDELHLISAVSGG
jgi:thiamine biosynthesis protein ThiS